MDNFVARVAPQVKSPLLFSDFSVPVSGVGLLAQLQNDGDQKTWQTGEIAACRCAGFLK
jgi:hypothetical protein